MNTVDQNNILALVEQRFSQVIEAINQKDQQYQIQFLSVKEAVLVQAISINERLASMNEFRLSLSDQTKTFIPRPEFEAKMNSIDKTILEIRETLNKSALVQSKGDARVEGMGSLVGWVFAGIATVIAVASFVISIGAK